MVLKTSEKSMQKRITLYAGNRLALELRDIVGPGLSMDLNDLIANNDPDAADVHRAQLVLVRSYTSCDFYIDNRPSTFNLVTEIPINVQKSRPHGASP